MTALRSATVAALVLFAFPDDCEARIVWRTAAGRIVLRKNFISSSHANGYCIQSAAWTPDSQFFVFNLYSSGGHSPWHFPTWFFSRRTASVAPLQNYISDPVTGAKLSVSAPDIVEVTTTALPLGTHPPVRRRISLGQLHHGSRTGK
ncbi:MAG: hypothetical protein P8Y71_29485 [Pseudolabrys sp.]